MCENWVKDIHVNLIMYRLAPKNYFNFSYMEMCPKLLTLNSVTEQLHRNTLLKPPFHGYMM